MTHLGPARPARTLGLAATDALAAPDGARTLIDRRGPDGELRLRVLDAGARGLHIEAPGHGAHLLAADGRSARCLAPDGYGARWQRLLLAQVLPTAAALQGLEPVHASAVVTGGQAVGFVAAAGVGKSTLAARLVATGADFLTDDVLALEPVDGEVLAHPGPARLLVETGAGEDKRAVELPVPDRPVRLGRLCFVVRGPRGAPPVLEPLDPPDPRLLLAAGFVGHLAAPARRVAHLEAMGRVATSVACARLTVPYGFGDADASALLARLEIA